MNGIWPGPWNKERGAEGAERHGAGDLPQLGGRFARPLEACLGIRLDWLLPATARSPWAQAWLAEERDRGLQQSPMAFPLGLLWEQSSVSI